MPSIARFCPQCKKYALIPVVNSQDLACSHCHQPWGKFKDIEEAVQKCPICACRQFYTDKDFNQVVGWIIMAAGIALVPMTYGLSLPFIAAIDWLIYKKVPKMIVCYRCGSEFRGFPLPGPLKPFMHHIGLKYDKYR